MMRPVAFPSALLAVTQVDNQWAFYAVLLVLLFDHMRRPLE